MKQCNIQGMTDPPKPCTFELGHVGPHSYMGPRRCPNPKIATHPMGRAG